jgi:arylsulfatase A-like enzyme
MRQPNILFVFSDQQRRHALGFMHADPVRTPHLDRFALQSAVCDNAIACNPICTPNRGIMMTGLYPTRTGVYANDHGLAPGTPTIGDHLQAAGYWTAYIGKWHIHNSASRFVPRDCRQGFDYWHATNCNHDTFTRRYWEEDGQPVIDEPGWQPPHETDVALRALRDRPADRPFALFLSWTPPHNTHGPGFTPHREIELPSDFAGEMREVGYPLEVQYHAPEEYEAHYANGAAPATRRPNVPGDYARDALPGYFGACESLDAEFGRLLAGLDRLGLAENTIVVYTSDHGEMLGSHGRMQKSIWYEESIGVPLLVRWPGRIAPARHPFVFNSMDWAPTLLGLAAATAQPTAHSGTQSTVHRDGAAARLDNAAAHRDGAVARLAAHRDARLNGANHSAHFDGIDHSARLLGETASPAPGAPASGAPASASLASGAPASGTPDDAAPASGASDNAAPADDALLCYFAMRHTQMEKDAQGAARGWRALRTPRHTYVVSRNRHTGELEHILYDLETDPYQLTPRKSAACLDPALQARLRAHLTRVADPFASLLPPPNP